MSKIPSSQNPSLSIVFNRVLKRLGFVNSQGWVEADSFDDILGPSGALRKARDTMGVHGAFGTWQYSATHTRTKRFIPLVYIAFAENNEIARDHVHRKIWSQGLVPLLIICTPTHVLLSEGYTFSLENWNKSIKQTSLDELDSSEPIDLDRLHAISLLSSLSWRDFAINPNDRVDKRLLSTLEALSKHLSRQSHASVRATNSLIGRFLYFYMLLDRNLIDNNWLDQFNASHSFDKRVVNLNIETVWKVFDALDSLLNGTIFPLTKSERSFFTDADVNLLRNCIKFGDELHQNGIQLSFIDFDLSSLQTETLSAIYEQFLETEDSSGKRQDGVFYTPPFLADFLLDRVEDEALLSSNQRIIDCTAGSGVFVVGAFRRLIERLLIQKKSTSLSAVELRKLLLNSIFAIEKNPSAHAVTTFSLYLTMLDYVDKADINLCLEGKSLEPLFPSLASKNVLCMDVFTDTAINWPTKFDVVIGNPPWQKINQITSNAEYVRNTFSKLVDSDEAAEYALWWALQYLAKDNALVALVLPTKSFVGPSAKRFPQSLAQKTELVGVVNFSNLRYDLFTNARQAASTILLRNNLPIRSSSFWTLAPTKAHLPGPINSNPWMLSLDRSQIERFNQRELQQNTNSWFELLMLRPIDRYIRKYLQDSIAIGKIFTLRRLFENVGVEVSRGGSPEQTGLPAELLYGADKFKSNDFRLAPGVSLIANVEQSQLFNKKDIASDFSWFKNVNKGFQRRFEGNMLIVPRSMQGLAYASSPIAFNSSLNVIYFKESATGINAKKEREHFLKFIGLFLESELAQYFFALTGSLWILDHTRLEKNDLLDLPIPIKNIDEKFIDRFLITDSSQRTKLLCEHLGLNEWLSNAANEYSIFRSDFEDGGIPNTFHNTPTSSDFELYKSTLQLAVRPISDGLELPEIEIINSENNNSALTVSVLLSKKDRPMHDEIKKRANYLNIGIADFSDSAYISTFNDDAFITLRKPAEKFRWTMESAFTDGAMLIQRLLEANHE